MCVVMEIFTFETDAYSFLIVSPSVFLLAIASCISVLRFTFFCAEVEILIVASEV